MKPRTTDVVLSSVTRFLLFCTLAACASSGAGTASHRTDESVITRAEIEEAHQPTLYDVVRALRPAWLHTQPTALQAAQETGITVYVDNQRAGGLEVLQEMMANTATALRFFSASEAQARFGLNNLHGVIQVTSNRGQPGGA